MESEIQVPLTKAGIQYLESGIHGLGSRNPRLFWIPYVGRYNFFRIDFSTEEVLFSFIHRRLVNYYVFSFIHCDRYLKKLAFLSPGIGTFAFDTRLGLYQDPPNKKGVHFINTVRKRFELSQQLTFNPVGKVASQYFETPTLKKFLKASDDLFDIGQDLVKQKLRELKKETEKGLNSSDGPQGNSR